VAVRGHAPVPDDRRGRARERACPRAPPGAAADNPAQDEFCAPFDLTARIPPAAVDGALATRQLLLRDVSPHADDADPLVGVFRAVQAAVQAADAAVPLRIVVPELGAPAWGDVSSRVCTVLEHHRS
jgi:hypothetical protein